MPKVLIPETNLNDITPWDGEQTILPPDDYAFRVEDCTIKPPKTTDKQPQLEFDLVVIGGASTDQYNGSSKKHWLSLASKAAGRVRNMLDACGVPVEADGGFDSDGFKGTEFIAEIYEESYDKPNLQTGETTPVVTSRLRKERPISAGWSNGEAALAAPSAPAAAPAASAAPAQAAPAALAAPAATPPAKAPAAKGPAQAPGALPRRPPVPPARR